MAINFLHYVCRFLFILLCIGHGDGRWKKKDRENLFREIDVFQRMADKIEQDVDTFYEEYPDEQIKEEIQDTYIKKLLDHKKDTKDLAKTKETKISYTNTSNEISAKLKSGYSSQLDSIHVSLTNNISSGTESSNWPKFEDILLEMGKRYDWKNDRWIKVKRKLKTLNKSDADSKSLEFHEKHKFSYRTVKLNSKRRKNVVIAVTAVR